MLDLLSIYLIAKVIHTIDLSLSPSDVVKNLDWLANKLRENGIDGDIYDQINEFRRELSSSIEKTLSYDQREKLTRNLHIWSGLIEGHLRKRRILEPSKPGSLSHEQLYEVSTGKPSVFFGDSWYYMSDIEQNDFKESSKCLLMQSWTAAAMIALRGLEGILRKYYEFKTKKQHENRGMYALIEELQNEESIEHTLMSYLNYLRGIRNTAEHPDRMFTQTEAETVFMQVAGAAREIHQEMKK